MKIYVVGSSKNNFLLLDNIREKFLIDEFHEHENIDFLNKWYCELTAIYYLLQHTSDNIIGLEHYRRYFINKNNKLLSENEIIDLLNNNDIICRKWIFKEHKQNNIIDCWSVSNYLIFKKFLNLLSKKEELFFKKKIKESSYFAQCNMFVGKREIINKYINWFLYHISKIPFNEIEKIPRIVGYISEFIFGFWLELNNFKICWNKSITYDKTLNKII